jgi:hypothetical protein
MARWPRCEWNEHPRPRGIVLTIPPETLSCLKRWKPCFHRARRHRSIPSAVLGPALFPPCRRQRPFLSAGDRRASHDAPTPHKARFRPDRRGRSRAQVCGSGSLNDYTRVRPPVVPGTRSLWQKSQKSGNAGETACATFGLQQLAESGSGRVTGIAPRHPPTEPPDIQVQHPVVLPTVLPGLAPYDIFLRYT